jgi:hypothetical protein
MDHRILYGDEGNMGRTWEQRENFYIFRWNADGTRLFVEAEM